MMTTGQFAEPPALGEATLAELRHALRGELILPADELYDEARSVWNGMIDRRPALIVRCTGTSDVIAAVGFARGGRDVWLAVALLVFAALFALRAYQLTADLQARDRIGAHDSGEKGEDLAGVLAPTEHVRHVGHRGRK
jgi:hypothetical protein